MAIRVTDVGLWAPAARATRPPGRTLPVVRREAGGRAARWAWATLTAR
jgi:hypothetical protein